MMVAICTPSRGLIFSKTVESIIYGMQELNKLGVATQYITCHDLTIPAAHNYCTETALSDSAVDKVFFIEEDMYVFPKAFVALATSDHDITTLQYNDKNGSPNGILHYNEAGDIIWCGLGATVIKRAVFERLGAPYFRTETRYRIIKKHLKDGKLISDYQEIEPRQVWSDEEKKFIEVRDPYKYGGLDVDFYTRARKVGYKIVALEEHRAHQFELVKLGEPHTNQGLHTIRQV